MRLFCLSINTKLFNAYCTTNLKFVPEHKKATTKDILLLQSFINKYKKIFILTGAGISTESGLPDYRSKGVGLYDRSSSRPVQYKDFVSSFKVRKRYWARNYVAWDHFSSKQPNKSHYCLADWEKKGFLNVIVTQNVDRLHHKAGSKHVIELHGSSYIVKCLDCGHRFSRYLLQKKFSELNPNFHATFGEFRPDADVDIDPALVETFNIVNCEKCGGLLKPDIVFFGESVPKSVVFDVYSKVEESDAVLVLGSSLEVFSGYRFVLAASEQKKPIGIVNIGPTRADSLANFKINTRCGDLLSMIET